MVHLVSVGSSFHARVIAARLGSDGIPTELRGAVDGPYPGMGQVDVYVRGDDAEVARYLFRRVVSWGRSSNVFLENGARLYLDVGSHPEYATPECDSIYDLVVHDKAGERILEHLLLSAEQRLREEGIRGIIYLFKNCLLYTSPSPRD